jgi:hypothetical protein
VLSLNTGFFERGVLHMGRTDIIKHYFKHYMTLDILASVPMNMIYLLIPKELIPFDSFKNY